MQIQLDSNTRIISDTYCYATERLQKAGRWLPYAFHPTLQQAVDSWVERQFRAVPDDVPNVLQAIESIHDTIRAALADFPRQHPPGTSHRR